MKNIVYIVAHPDDESLWVGGTISALNKSEHYNIYVLCLWGLLEAPDEHREESFYKATADCKKSYIFVRGSKQGDHPIEDGLKKMSLAPSEVDLIITHPPYGDEHQQPHHKIAYHDSKNWSDQHGVPVGNFSFFAMPFTYKQIALHAKRLDGLHLLNLFQVTNTHENEEYKFWPKYFIQFLVDIESRNQMLENYHSIDASQHKDGYFGWTSNCEGYYLDDAGLEVMNDLIESMPTPTNSESLYTKYHHGI